MCKNEIALANHFFGLLAATFWGRGGFKEIQNIDSMLRVLSIPFLEQKFFNSYSSDMSGRGSARFFNKPF
jgi:hypothetical protein